MGLVVFAGNGSELRLAQGACDTDATLVRPLARMDSTQQLALAEDVDDMTAGGYASIGDGLVLALFNLSSMPEPADKKRILLLSDGMENEASLWASSYTRCGTAPVSSTFDASNPGAIGAGIRIDARGFGNDADIDFLRKLTGLTGGVAQSVPTEPPAVGEGTVTLYFAEICSACVSRGLGGRGCSTCKREFLVAVEDQSVVYNPADAVVPPARDGIGKLHVATELVFEVEVTDAALNVDLADSGTGSEHAPLIQALSIRNDSSDRSLSILRGDCNDDGAVDISDGICTLNWLFLGKGGPVCIAAPDSNGDRVVDISDATYTLSHLFLGGPAPVPPFPACGRLPAAEASSCAQQPESCRG